MNKKWSDLSQQEQNEIKRKYESGIPPSELAKQYGLKSKQISDQAYRKGWKSPNIKSKKTTAKKASKKTKKTAKKAKK